MNTPKKILYVITKSSFGGAQKYVYELARAARAAGYDVSVACGGTGTADARLGLLFDKLTEAGIRVIPVRHFMRDMSLGRDLAALFELISLIWNERPEVLHVTSSKAGGLGALAGRLCRVPKIIFTSHGLPMDEVWRPRWQRALITCGTWLTLTLAHQTIMITAESYDRARHLPGLRSKVSLIRNGIAPLTFLDTDTARSALAPSVPKDISWLGGVGELHPNKNWAVVITALTSLPSRVHLFIIGEGEERSQLELLTKKVGLTGRVHLLGYIDAAHQYLRAFDVFLLPSKKEGLPYVLLEAGLCGLPVVASDLPGNRDIIDTGENGFLIDPSPTVITASLSMLLRDDGMTRRLGGALREKVSSVFSIDKMVDATFACYESSNSRAL
jgi:glycosyltransferase involved in cell wall biosynthesis